MFAAIKHPNTAYKQLQENIDLFSCTRNNITTILNQYVEHTSAVFFVFTMNYNFLNTHNRVLGAQLQLCLAVTV